MKITEGQLAELAGRVHERLSDEPLTPLEHVRISNRFEEPDRLPVILQICEHAAKRLGTCPIKEA